VVVANRGGDLVVLSLPLDDADGEMLEADPIDPPQGQGFDLVSAPGSLAVLRGSEDAEILVCNNTGRTVTSHVVDRAADPLVVSSNSVLLRRWLELPDGVTVSADCRWMAVSDHRRQVVMVYDRSSGLDESSPPCAVLRGAFYPHGLRFAPDGGHLFVADSGSPHVQVFARVGELWEGAQYPAFSLRVMSDEVFRRGRHNPQEGGPKGIDIDRSGRILALTSECQPLACFDLAAIIERGADASPNHALNVAYELGVVEEAEHQARIARERVAAVRNSTSFRVTAPFRHLSVWLRRGR
jgi:hypothetical protein